MTYKDRMKELAKFIESDGCTSVPDFYLICCHEHDWNLATGYTPRGRAITTKEAHQRFRDCIQSQSPLRFLSPMSWWRWIAVNTFSKPKEPPFPVKSSIARKARLAIVSDIIEKEL